MTAEHLKLLEPEEAAELLIGALISEVIVDEGFLILQLPDGSFLHVKPYEDEEAGEPMLEYYHQPAPATGSAEGAHG